MVANGSLAKRHLTRAQQVGAFTAQNLKDAVFLRNRMGFNLAFMEDPLLTGMLAARATKGLASKIRADAIQEAQKEAKRLKEEGKLTAAARELIGPRGGLPVLRQDLLRLATLLHVEIAEGDTMAKLKEKCRPAVDLLMAKTKHVKEPEAKGRPSKSSSASSPEPKAKSPPPSATLTEDPNNLSLQQVQALMESQESRFQTMLSQVMQHVNLQSNINPVLPVVESPDDSMGSFEEVNQAEDLRRRMGMTGAADQQISDEEVQRLNAEYYAEMRRSICRDLRLEDDAANPWEINQHVKKGLGQMIAQAWQQHERDRVLVSNSPKDVLDVSVNNGMMLRTKV